MAPDGLDLPQFLRLAADPLRWRLLAELGRSDLRVRELTERVGEPQSLVSYHLRLLRESGLITATRSTHDGRESYYHLDLGRCGAELAAVGSSLHPALHPGPGAAAETADRRGSQPSSVLFLCTGNSARSPLAEAMLRSRVDDRWAVASAGSHPKAGFHPAAVAVLSRDYGLRIGGQRPRSWAALTGGRFDWVVSLCDKAREQWTSDSGQPPRAHWSIPDPAAAGGARAFQRAAQDIDARVGHLLAVIASSPPVKESLA